MKLFHFGNEVTKKSLFVKQEAKVPLEIGVVMGKRHIVGVGELGSKSVTVEKAILPFGKPIQVEDVAKEILKKLGVPESEWESILGTKKEM